MRIFLSILFLVYAVHLPIYAAVGDDNWLESQRVEDKVQDQKREAQRVEDKIQEQKRLDLKLQQKRLDDKRWDQKQWDRQHGR